MIQSFCMGKYYTIVKDNAKSIRAKCAPVENITQKEIDLVNSMKDYLVASQTEEIRERYHMREGVGLAAPQIGKNIRALVVYYETPLEDGSVKIVDHRLINPKIISESVKETYLSAGEGCLSVDGEHQGYVYRKYKIMVKAFDVKTQKDTTITASGFEAIVLQHELDHLDGILFYDHIDKKNPFFEKPDTVRL